MTTTTNLGLTVGISGSDTYQSQRQAYDANFQIIDELYGDLLDTLSEIDAIYDSIVDVEESA